MAQVVLGVGSSHGPSIQLQAKDWPMLGKKDPNDPRFDFEELLRNAPPGLDAQITPEVQKERHAAARAALKTLTATIADAKLDVVIVVSNPHRIRKADYHPVFSVYRADSFLMEHRVGFDPDKRFVDEDKRGQAKETIERRGLPALANHLVDELIAADFDVACMDALPEGTALDDAFVFPFDWLLGDNPPPLVPFMLSRDLPNQAHPGRCYRIGQALHKVIESWPENARVGLIASGGLSHQILDEELDRTIIKGLTEGDADILSSLPRDRLNRGPGTPEGLNWVTVAGAMAPTAMTLVDYQPAYRSLAGTGHGLTFGYWHQ